MSSTASSSTSVRPPAVAGTFYPSDPQQCRELARSLVHGTGQEARPPQASDAEESMRHGRVWVGGLVPHAGWICSGAIAGQTIRALAQGPPASVVVVFGAVHTPIPIDVAALDSFGRWHVPGGDCQVEQEIRRRLEQARGDLFVVDDRFHRREHAVEVELPLIREAWPDATIVPIEVPADPQAVEIGRATARVVAPMIGADRRVIFLASSDLTHYGPAYDFAPAGIGQRGLAWAKQNDRRLLDQVLALREQAIVPEVQRHLNACGGGAIAAMLAACRELGCANEARLLSHANSFETLAEVAPQPPDNAVGYASIVVG